MPKDCIPALDILCNHTFREQADVLPDNDFLFPSTNSMQHCNGWDATAKACQKADVVTLHTSLNATAQRVRLSTIYAAQEYTPTERTLFIVIWGTPQM